MLSRAPSRCSTCRTNSAEHRRPSRHRGPHRGQVAEVGVGMAEPAAGAHRGRRHRISVKPRSSHTATGTPTLSGTATPARCRRPGRCAPRADGPQEHGHIKRYYRVGEARRREARSHLPAASRRRSHWSASTGRADRPDRVGTVMGASGCMTIRACLVPTMRALMPRRARQAKPDLAVGLVPPRLQEA